LTWQNDTYRTGDNLNETTLTYSSVGKDTFGQLCSAQLDGQVYAQPLVVTNVTIGSTFYPSVVYVVTQKDSVYAINGTPPSSGNTCQVLLGPVSLLNGNFSGQPTMSAVDCANIGMGHCDTIKPMVGVLGTPVINVNSTSNTGTLYVVAEMQSGNSESGFTFYHFLHALDITTLAEGIGNEVAGAPIQICGGTGCGVYTSTLFSHDHIQRPGLLFANCGSGCNSANYVYVAFSMMDDTGYPFPNGVIFGYNASNLSGGTVFYLPTSVGSEDQSNGGGIWQGGAGPAFGTDSSGSSWIYLNTANGTWDGSSNWGDSLLKLNPNGLTVANNGFFTPADQNYRSNQNCGGDVDFGSGGVMLIPDSEVPNYPYLTVSGEKEGYLWFLDRTTPGGHVTSCDSSCSCSASEPNIVEKYSIGRHGQGFHNSPAFWETTTDNGQVINNYIYAMSFPAGPLVQYALCATPSTPPPSTVVCGSLTATDGSGNQIDMKNAYGSTPTVSATAPETAADAIVWVLVKPDGHLPKGTVPGILYAFDAMSMRELYDSNMCASDNISPATKFSVPTVANKYVYLGTEQAVKGTNTDLGMFYIFGTRTTCS